ncbi:MAG: polysaccharide lyase [Dermatophilaceae bacterium]
MKTASLGPWVPSDGAPPPDPGTPVLEENFATHNSAEWQPYTVDMLKADFEDLKGGDYQGIEDDGSVWPAKTTVGKGVLRAHFPANSAGTSKSGFMFNSLFPGAEEATLEYRVLFEGAGPDKKFVSAEGGKLPGLSGTAAEKPPTGCLTDQDIIDNGFSARTTWRAGGTLVAYLYTPDRNPGDVACGLDIPFFEGAVADKWYTIRQHIRMNTPGERDGLLDMYVDGKRTLHKTDMYYRISGKSDVKIDRAMFHTFRGGKDGDPRFFSPNDDHLQFDHFKIWVK